MTSESQQVVNEIKRAAEQPPLVSEEQTKEIVRQLQRLTTEVEVIDANCKAGALEGWFRPKGNDGRTWEQEFDFALAHRAEGYVPTMTYPALEREYLDPNNPQGSRLDIQGGLDQIEKLKERVDTEFPDTKDLANKILAKTEKRFLFLDAIKRRDHDAVIAHMPHGKPSEELEAFAKNLYQESLKLKPKQDEEIRKLSRKQFNSQDIKEYFEYALDLLGASDWTVETSNRQRAITVTSEKRNIGIPLDSKVTGSRLLRLIAHEIGVHVGTVQNALKNGFGSISIGTEASVLQEGLAKLAEHDVERLLQGYESPTIPFYCLGIIKAVENGGNFWETYDYLVELNKTVSIAQGKPEKLATRQALSKARKDITRLFKGAVDLRKGGYVYTKDKAYVEGEMIAQQIKDIGLLGIMLSGKFDVDTAIYLLKSGVIDQNSRNLVVDIAHKIWGNEADKEYLLNSRWYKENRNESHWRELGISDEDYIEALIKGHPIKR